MKPYARKAQYYETDQMGIIHHSNYLRWFEEARIDFMEQMGLSYAALEQLGIMIPVLNISCIYKQPVRFNNNILIHSVISSFNGIKLSITYTITDTEDKVTYSTGETEHCFLNNSFKPVSLKRDYPEVFDIFNNCKKGNADE